MELGEVVSSPKGRGRVVGFPEPGLVEVRLLEDQECFVFEVKDGELAYVNGKPPVDLREEERKQRRLQRLVKNRYALADDLDQPLIEVVTAAEYVAKLEHDKEEARWAAFNKEE